MHCRSSRPAGARPGKSWLMKRQPSSGISWSRGTRKPKPSILRATRAGSTPTATPTIGAYAIPASASASSGLAPRRISAASRAPVAITTRGVRISLSPLALATDDPPVRAVARQARRRARPARAGRTAARRGVRAKGPEPLQRRVGAREAALAPARERAAATSPIATDPKRRSSSTRLPSTASAPSSCSSPA